MWPKLLSQLIEILPHATRLVPIADRFLQSGSQNAEATLRAIEGLRADVNSNTSNEALYRQLNEQALRLDAVASESRATRAAMEEIEGRITRLDRKLRSQSNMLAALIALSVALLICVLFLLLRH